LKQRIAVTGASGFIGQSICRQLLTREFSVRALIREPRQVDLPALRGAEIVHGSLTDQSSLARLVADADAVIHCAGSVRGATQAQFDRVNVTGTRNLLLAIKASETRSRLLFVSSLAAREPRLSFYAASKYRAEQLLKNEGEDISWACLRLPAVYGPGDRELLPLLRLMARGIALTTAAAGARFSMLYIDDLAAAAIAWLRSDPPPEGIYTVDDGHAGGYDWHDLARTVGEICHRKVRIVAPAAWLLDVPAWFNGRIGAIFDTAPMLTPEKLRELRHHDWVCNNDEFQRVVAWHPQVQIAEGLRTTPGWQGHRRTDRTAI
jgi:nucleoside-diphosphate-sugar epimerase